MTVQELIDALEEMPPDMDVVAHTEFTAQYGEGVWVHISTVEDYDHAVILGERFA